MFCQNCGAELQEGASFCTKCGTKVNNQINNSTSNREKNGVECLFCGSFIPAGLDQCPYCRKYINPKLNKNYNDIIVLGYILSILIPLGGLICGIYLVTREKEEVHTHGIVMIVISVAIFLVVIFTIISIFNLFGNLANIAMYYN